MVHSPALSEQLGGAPSAKLTIKGAEQWGRAGLVLSQRGPGSVPESITSLEEAGRHQTGWGGPGAAKDGERDLTPSLAIPANVAGLFATSFSFAAG